MSGTSPEVVATDVGLTAYGVDSAKTIQLVRELGERVGRRLPATAVWEYPTIAALAEFATGASNRTAVAATIDPAQANEPLAVVGMSCRFARAADVAAFWRLLREAVDATSDIPEGRWDVATYYDRRPSVPGKAVARRAALLDDIVGFDPLAFGISPREADELDPAQRLALELSWEALEDAGIGVRSLEGTTTGVFFGSMWHDWADLTHADVAGMSSHRATGQASNMIANRVSYALGLRGPSVVVDTACSSSLVALHLAGQALRDGDATLALVGGVNLIMAPETMVFVSKFGGLAPDGRCKAFDARGDGFGRGEGGAVLAVKRLGRARRDGDRVLAIVRGTAVNNDGASHGLTAPNPRAQEEVLAAAYRRAGFAPEDVHYVETHGTGTVLGDPIEAGALGAVVTARRPAEPPLLIGSVKTNIGHTEAAAGVASVVKTILAMQHRAVPPNLHFAEPNPHIDFAALKLHVPTTVEPWPAPDDTPARAGVSAFGWGGTNAHVVLESPPPAASLFTLAAPDDASLADLAIRLAADIEAAPFGMPPVPVQPDSGPARLAAVTQSPREIASALRAFAGGRPPPRVHVGRAPDIRPGLVFVFSPLGSQWVGMGRQMLACEPAFRAALGRCDRALRPLLGRSVLDDLTRDAPADRFDDVVYAQPLLFAIQVAVAETWRGWGVEPDAVAGHSAGEIAAAHVAGALSLADAACAIHHYSRVQGPTSGRGAMAVVDMAPDALEPLLEPWAGRVEIAARNSRRSTVISGEAEGVRALLSDFERRGVEARAIRVDVAGHSPQMSAALLRELEAALAHLRPRSASLPFHSSVTGSRLDGRELDGGYWARNLRSPVQFSTVVERLLGEGHGVFVEIGPHPVLARALAENFAQAGRSAVALPSLQRGPDERLPLLETRAQLFVRGIDSRAPARAQLLPLSAHTAEALSELAAATAAAFRGGSAPALADAAYTAGVRRSHHAHRLAVVGHDPSAVAAALSAAACGEAHPEVERGAVEAGRPPRVVFVFPGQGSQWLGMGRQLYATEPVFRESLQDCAQALERQVDWSLLAEIHAGASASQLARNDVLQPTLWAIQVSLAALWRAFGVEPAAVVGHSMGELAAAVTAGALTLEDGARIIARRSRLAYEGASGRGAMALVELSFAEATRAVAGHDGVAVGVSNGPRSSVLSGDPGEIERILARLRERGIFCRLVKVDYASHGPQMEPLVPLLHAALADIRPRSPQVPFCSTLLGGWIDGRSLDAAYWADNLRQPVLFAQAVQKLAETGHDVFLEISPHPVLVPAIVDGLSALGHSGVALASLRREEDDRANLLRAAAVLYSRGAMPDFSALSPDGGHVVPLPSYRWQRSRHWFAPPDAVQPRASSRGSTDAAGSGHDDAADDGADALISVSWAPAQAQAPAPASTDGRWIIVGDGRGTAARIDAALARRGRPRSTVVRDAADCGSAVARALADGAPVRGIIHLGGLDVEGDGLDGAVARGSASVLAVLQQVAEQGDGHGSPAFTVVTRGAHAVLDGDAVDPWQALLPALTQTLAYEHPEIRFRFVDLPLATAADDSDRIVDEALAERFDQVALREDRRYVARLVRRALSRPVARYQPSSDRTYLLTGGLGGLGLGWARWLVEHGARHLVLVGRTGCSAAGQAAAVEALRASGARVEVAALDVADEAALARLFSEISARMPPLRGIFHAAAVLEDAVAMQQSPERLRRVLLPKALGALHLHRLSQGLDLDAFVLYSSMAALVGSPGQSNYAAANGFVEALACLRRAHGLPALAIAFGSIADVGLAAADERRGARLASRGIQPLALERANGLLARLLVDGTSRVVAARFDVGQWIAFHPMVAGTSLFAGLGEAPLPPPPDAQPAPRESRRLPPGATPAGTHPLIGDRRDVGDDAGTHVFETTLSATAPAWLADHRVAGRVVLPSTAYLEMAAAVASALGPVGPCEVVELELESMLELDAAARVQVVVRRDRVDRARFQVLRLGDGGEWTRCAHGVLRTAAPAGGSPGERDAERRAAEARCSTNLIPSEHYARMQRVGLEYGPCFRGISSLRRGRGEAVARVRLPDAVDPAPYSAAPPLLDACFQAVLAAAGDDDSSAYLPVAIRGLRLHLPLPAVITCHAALTPGSGDPLRAALRVWDAAGRLLAEVDELTLRRVALLPSPGQRLLFDVDWQPTQPPAPRPAAGAVFVLAGSDPAGPALSRRLGAVLLRIGSESRRLADGCWEVPDDSRALAAVIREAAGERARPWADVIVDTRALDDVDRADLEGGRTSLVGSRLAAATRVVRAIAASGVRDVARLYLVTRRAQPADGAGAPCSVSQAAVWGFGRTLMHEHPELRPTLVDIGADEIDALAAEVTADTAESQVALRGDARIVARLVPASEVRRARRPAGSTPFRLELPRTGGLDAVVARALQRRAPAAGQVEIEVAAVGLNLLDVLLALGALDDPDLDGQGPPLGRECVGRVVRADHGVTSIAVGDEVVAFAPRCLGTHVLADERLVRRRPAGLDLEAAATLPLAFATAEAALVDAARLAAGERVLIHAAAGGVGLAAIQLARRLGAEVFATAGSESKRALLRGMGCAHVFHSRDLSFADGVRAATGGEGVDVVLNSLAGDFIPASLELLRDHGRFVELGKRDYAANRRIGLRPFLRQLSYSLVDLRHEMSARPERAGALLERVLRRAEAGDIEPLPRRVFPIADAVEALSTMARAEHVGKLVISLADAARTPIEAAPAPSRGLAADRAYLVTGGLGGIGLRAAGALVDAGARHLVLVDRGAPSAAAGEEIARMRASGAAVEVCAADVAAPRDLDGIVAAIDAGPVRLGGVVHGVEPPADAPVAKLTGAELEDALRPTLDGAWTLHRVTVERPLDIFVVCSSTAAVLGGPGDAARAAAGAFLDALANERQAHGLRGLSILWGPWEGSNGADPERAAARGFEALTSSEGAAAFLALLREDAPARLVMGFHPQRYKEFHLGVARAPFLSLLAEATAPGRRRPEADARAKLEALAPEARRPTLERHLTEQIARVLRCPPARIGPATPLQQVGLDSLMAMELRNLLESTLRVRLNVTLIWRHPTVVDLAGHLATAMGWRSPQEDARPDAGGLAGEPKALQDAARLGELLRKVKKLAAEGGEQ